MSAKAPSQTTQTTEVKLPAWVEAASQSNYDLAKKIAAKPFTQYEGNRVADPSKLSQQAYGLLQGPLNTGAWYNPEINAVEKRALDAADRSRRGALMQVSDEARAAKAFGGSRFGIESAVTNAEALRGMGDLSANLRKQAYDSAVANAMSDRSFRVQGLLGAGAEERGIRQQKIDADMQRFAEKQGYDLEGLNTRLAALGMSPYGKTETSHRTGTSESAGPDWATIGLGALKALPGIIGMFSDRRDKTDIEKLGTDPSTGLPMYAYRYKKDPKTYPKVVGPMAQDIEKAYPESVSHFGGHKIVTGMLAA